MDRAEVVSIAGEMEVPADEGVRRPRRRLGRPLPRVLARSASPPMSAATARKACGTPGATRLPGGT